MISPEPIALTDADRRAMSWIEARQDALVERLRAWCLINSGSANTDGLERMRSVITGAFAPLGARSRPRPLPDSEIVAADGEVTKRAHPPALEVVQRPDAPVQVALTGHSDTVFPADSPFQSWRMAEEDVMNGPGAADMKGGILVMATALEAFERFGRRDRLGYAVLISPDEEIGSPGSAPVLAELGARAHLGMTYEPALADGGLAGARKGSGNYSLVVRGRAAHAGREHAKGRSALEAAARFTVGLEALNGAREGVTFNVGRLDGGGPVNMVPDLAVCRFNVRVTDADNRAWADGEIARLVGEVEARDGLAARLHGGVTRPPKPMVPANAALFGFAKTVGASLDIDLFWNDTGGVCEGNNLWAAGCPNVDTLGVRGAHIHTDQEIVVLSSLTERAKLSALMLMKIADGAVDAPALRAL
ncbi:MAG: hydrolase [Caulobacterales bacterium]|nr:hydrolase [Caulobacterales bacterium]